MQDTPTLEFHSSDLENASSPVQYHVGSGAINSSASFAPENASSQQVKQPSLQYWLSCLPYLHCQKYFDFDTSDITNRVAGSLLHVNSPDHFLENIIGVIRTDEQSHHVESHSVGNPVTENRHKKGPDLYGPIWISLTLVFFVAVTSNITAYVHSDGVEDFEYDISHLANAMVVLLSFTFALPTLFYVLFRYLQVDMTWSELVCLYGYSLVPYLPTTLLCILPSVFLEWILLLLATFLSVVLILRNVTRPILRSEDINTRSKAGPILMSIMVFHIGFLLVLKLKFYHHSKVSHHNSSGNVAVSGDINDKVSVGEQS